MAEHAHGEATGVRATGRLGGTNDRAAIARAALDRLAGLVRLEQASVALIPEDDREPRTLATLPPSGNGQHDGGTGRRRLTPVRSGTILTFPLEHAGHCIGLLSFAPASSDPFTPGARRACQRLAEELAAALAGAQRAGATREAELERRVCQRTADLEERVARLEADNARLSALNGELQTFARALTHDLLSPIRTIRAAAQALVSDAGEALPSSAREHADRVEETGRRLARLVDDLEVYSRVGGREERRVPIDLREVVDEALAQVRDEIERARAEVTVTGPFPEVLGHHASLVQALMNLVTNAIKFVEPGSRPRVWIDGAVVEGRGRLRVNDRGIGIPGDDLVRVFRLFERLHGAERYPGSGMGLAIVQRSVTRLGGRVGAESMPGEGSCFWLDLPLTT